MQDQSRHPTRRQLIAAAFGSVGILLASHRTSPGALSSNGTVRGKRVLLGISDFSESLETYYMYFRLKEEGAVPVVVAPEKKQIEMVIHFDKPDYLSYLEKPGYPIEAQVASKDVDPDQYDGLLLPGGRAPEELRLNPGMQKIAAHFLDQQKPLGAMCHGVMLLYTVRSIQGRRLTANRQIQPDIEHHGAEFLDQPVVADGRLVTSRGWTDLDAFMPAFLEQLARK